MKHYILVAANGVVGDVDLSEKQGPFATPQDRITRIKEMYATACRGDNFFNPERDIIHLVDVECDDFELTLYRHEENRYYLEDGDVIFQHANTNDGIRLLVRKCTATDTVEYIVDQPGEEPAFFTTEDATVLPVQWEDCVPYVVIPDVKQVLQTLEDPELDKIETALREAGANDHYISVIMDPIDPDAGDPWGQAWNNISSEISFFKDLRDAVQ